MSKRQNALKCKSLDEKFMTFMANINLLVSEVKLRITNGDATKDSVGDDIFNQTMAFLSQPVPRLIELDYNKKRYLLEYAAQGDYCSGSLLPVSPHISSLRDQSTESSFTNTGDMLLAECGESPVTSMGLHTVVTESEKQYKGLSCPCNFDRNSNPSDTSYSRLLRPDSAAESNPTGCPAECCKSAEKIDTAEKLKPPGIESSTETGLQYVNAMGKYKANSLAASSIVFRTASTTSPTVFGAAPTTSPTVIGTASTSTPTVLGTAPTSPTVLGTAPTTSPTVLGTVSTSRIVLGTAPTTSPTVLGTAPTTSPTVLGTASTSPTMLGTASTSPTMFGTTPTTSPTVVGRASTTSLTVFGTASTTSPIVLVTTSSRRIRTTTTTTTSPTVLGTATTGFPTILRTSTDKSEADSYFQFPLAVVAASISTHKTPIISSTKNNFNREKYKAELVRLKGVLKELDEERNSLKDYLERIKKAFFKDLQILTNFITMGVKTPGSTEPRNPPLEECAQKDKDTLVEVALTKKGRLDKTKHSGKNNHDNKTPSDQNKLDGSLHVLTVERRPDSPQPITSQCRKDKSNVVVQKIEKISDPAFQNSQKNSEKHVQTGKENPNGAIQSEKENVIIVFTNIKKNTSMDVEWGDTSIHTTEGNPETDPSFQRREDSPDTSVQRREDSPETDTSVQRREDSPETDTSVQRREDSPETDTSVQRREDSPETETSVQRREDSPETDTSVQRREDSPETDTSVQRREDSPETDTSVQRREDSPDTSAQRREDSPDTSVQRREDSPETETSVQRREDSPDTSVQRREDSPDTSVQRREDSPDTSVQRREGSPETDTSVQRREGIPDTSAQRREGP
ncbi:hypothetical protein EGW08_002960 [Elysia chlorotica]|uniref:Uncharacterized protein n=1 Tax=Elysia chlorotica TaxID=188477 RepID=A0A433U614_ELYCH|nr:hypothetical protein EGW08_002960 [Elysia chlorotica]